MRGFLTFGKASHTQIQLNICSNLFFSGTKTIFHSECQSSALTEDKRTSETLTTVKELNHWKNWIVTQGCSSEAVRTGTAPVQSEPGPDSGHTETFIYSELKSCRVLCTQSGSTKRRAVSQTEETSRHVQRLTKAADSYIWRVPAGLQVQTSDITTQVSEITITSTETHKSKLFHFLMLQLLFFFINQSADYVLSGSIHRLWRK